MHLWLCCREIADVLKEAIQEEEPNELSYKNEVDELMTALTAMKANSSENENMEDVLLEKSKNGDEENISVIAEASGTPVSAPKTEENLTNLGDKHSKSKKRNKRMPAVTKLVDGDFDSFKDSLLHEEHFSSVWLLTIHYCEVLLITAPKLPSVLFNLDILPPCSSCARLDT